MLEAHVRELDVLDPFLLAEDPRLPVGVAVLHGPEDDPRHLQARVAQSHCAAYSVSQR